MSCLGRRRGTVIALTLGWGALACSTSDAPVSADAAAPPPADLGTKITGDLVSFGTWSADSQLFVYGTFPVFPPSMQTLKAFAPAAGTIHQIWSGPVLGAALVTPDRRFVVGIEAEASEGAGPAAPLVVIDVATATGATLAMADRAFPPVLAPDGDHVAFLAPGTSDLMVASIAARTSERKGMGAPLAFSPDGTSILVGMPGQRSSGSVNYPFMTVPGQRPFDFVGTFEAAGSVYWDATGPKVLVDEMAPQVIDLAVGTRTMLAAPSPEFSLLTHPAWYRAPTAVTFGQIRCASPGQRPCLSLWGTVERLTFQSNTRDTLASGAGPLMAMPSPDGHTLILAADTGLYAKTLP